MELKPLKSFAIELVMVHVLAINSKEGSIEMRFRDFLLYIAQSGLKDVIDLPPSSLTNLNEQRGSAIQGSRGREAEQIHRGTDHWVPQAG